MSKYGDDHTCTCEMNLVSCKNSFHADKCDLWNEESFKSGLDEWDGDLGTLVLAASPWDKPEEWVWNNDEPVVRVSTLQERNDAAMLEAVAEWETLSTPVADAEFIPALEQEVIDALTEGASLMDGLVELPDGSYADFELRVTYRKVEQDGAPVWVEEFWDAGVLSSAERAALVAEDSPTKVYDCTCVVDKKFYCSVCNVQRDKVTDPWRYWGGHNTTGSSQTYVSSYSWHHCDHCFDTFVLPGAQHENIKISAKRQHTASTTPDFGLYAYAGWSPSCIATFIPWQDYGLPTVDYVKAAEAIVMAWDLSCAGKTVEVGCMGGHGRTGTILGCLAILSNPDMSARQAISHVRKVHCDEAIETNQQEWFIEWFRAWYLGETCRPMPTTYVSKHSANWKAAGSAAKAVKETVPALPKAQGASPSGGSTTKPQWTWCAHCKRTVGTMHNGDCPFSLDDSERVAPEQYVDTGFTPIPQGQTANARRRNAKRANRRAARRRQAQQSQATVTTGLQDILQEYV